MTKINGTIKLVVTTLIAGTMFTIQSCKKEEEEPEAPEPVVVNTDISGTSWTSIEASYVSNERIMGMASYNGQLIFSFLDYADPSNYYLSGHLTSSGTISKHSMNYTGGGSGFEKIEVVDGEILGIGSWYTNGVWSFDPNYFTSPSWNVWSPLTAYSSSPLSITKFAGDYILGYSTAPYVQSDNITFPDVSGTAVRINDMIVYNGDLIIAGDFDDYSGTVLNNIARWDGTGWSPLGTGVDGKINDLDVLDGQLIVGGDFSEAGGNTNCQNIAIWSGSSWVAMETGLTGGFNGVRKLLVFGSQLFAGGDFDGSASVNSPNVIKWKNGSWSALPTTVSEPIGEMGIYKGHLYIANAFNIQGQNFLLKLE